MDTMASALIGESDPEERQKIQDRIEALTSQFAALDTFESSDWNDQFGRCTAEGNCVYV